MAQKVAERTPPPEVERAISLGLIAVGAGIFETLLRVVHAFATQPTPGSTVWDATIRMLLCTALWSLVLRLRRGEHWLRISLAVVLGGLAALCTVVPVVSSMIAGHAVLSFLPDSGGWMVAFATVQAGYTVAVLLATIRIFSPEASRFFLRSRVTGPTRQRSPRRKDAPARRRR